MVITNDKINSKVPGILDQLDGFDSTIECDDQSIAVTLCEINASSAHAVPFPVTVRYVKFKILMDLIHELIHASHGRCTIHIIIAKHQDLFLGFDGRNNSVNGLFHVFHEPWIVQVR